MAKKQANIFIKKRTRLKRNLIQINKNNKPKFFKYSIHMKNKERK